MNKPRPVLVLAPLGRDASSAVDLITGHGLQALAVSSVAELAAKIDEDTGAVMVTEEALVHADLAPLAAAIKAQASWSDIPFLFLAAHRVGPQPRSDPRRGALPSTITNVITLERPLSSVSLLSALDWALTARSRQFEIRDKMLELEDRAEKLRETAARLQSSEAALRNLNETLEQRIEERTSKLMLTESHLRQAQKMEAVGQLTGGIAHDFNNMLTGIMGALDIMKRRIASGRVDDLERFMDTAITSGQRAAALTHRLLAFSRRQSLESKPVDLNLLVESLHDLLHRTTGEQITIVVRPGEHLPYVTSDPSQLENAIVNLVINARDAMPDGGCVTIETARVQIDEAAASAVDGLEAGGYAMVSVTDTGAGMPEHVLAKVFEPFFTTKPIGQGTGLGLSMIYGFARQSGGNVQIESQVGVGTTVRLYLPLAEDAPSPQAEPVRNAPLGDGETVLLVEDDPSVRVLVLEVLSELRYHAIEAADAQAALPILQSNARIDLLVTDVGLPGMNGRQLADIGRQSRPDLGVLFITGYAEGAATRSGFLDPGMEIITKPFALDNLAVKIRQMIERACQPVA